MITLTSHQLLGIADNRILTVSGCAWWISAYGRNRDYRHPL